MPFQDPWRTYQQGDLFYGLNTPRNNLVTYLRDVKKVNIADTYIVDQYALFVGEKVGPLQTALKYDQDFINCLNNHAKYNTAVGQDLNTMAKTTITGYPDQLRVHDAAVAKRKSKGGLEYILRNTTYHIHFVLTGLNMEQIPAKTFDGAGGKGVPDLPQGKSSRDWKDKTRSITGAELRWVYRNRNDPVVRAKVQFWLGINPCGPPWEAPSDPNWVKAWAAYHPTHEWTK
jgi:hypothetical protein